MAMRRAEEASEEASEEEGREGGEGGVGRHGGLELKITMPLAPLARTPSSCSLARPPSSCSISLALISLGLSMTAGSRLPFGLSASYYAAQPREIQRFWKRVGVAPDPKGELSHVRLLALVL